MAGFRTCFVSLLMMAVCTSLATAAALNNEQTTETVETTPTAPPPSLPVTLEVERSPHKYFTPPPEAYEQRFVAGQPSPFCRRRGKVCVNSVLYRCNKNRQLKALIRPKMCNVPCMFPHLNLSIANGEHFICLNHQCNLPRFEGEAPEPCTCLRCDNGDLVEYIKVA